MFKNNFAQYIADNLTAQGMTYRDIAQISGVPLTTLTAYAKGQVGTPNEEYCAKIVAAFGDPPQTLDQLKRSAPVPNDSALATVEAYRQKAEEEYAARLSVVREQYESLLQTMQGNYDRQLAQLQKASDALLAQANAHAEDNARQYAAGKEYLKSVIRKLSAVSATAVICAFSFGAYGIYAYQTFDVKDLSQGLAQHGHTAAPFVFTLIVVCAAVCAGLRYAIPKMQKKEK